MATTNTLSSDQTFVMKFVFSPLWIGGFVIVTLVMFLSPDSLRSANGADVVEVTENVWINIHPVTIHLRSETELGQRIVFMPKARWFVLPWSSHPVVEQIRRAVINATGAAPAGPVE